MPVNVAPWPSPLLEARFVSRHQRFLALVELEGGERVVAHCVNPGRMEGLVIAGARVWLTRSDDPKRKLRYTLELVER
jgi:sugar fermentation stimulation protein A